MSQRSLCGDVRRLTRVMIELWAEEEEKTKRVKRVLESPLMINALSVVCRVSYDEAGVDVVFFSHVHVRLQLHAGVVVCKHRRGWSSDSVSARSSICLYCGLSANLTQCLSKSSSERKIRNFVLLFKLLDLKKKVSY